MSPIAVRVTEGSKPYSAFWIDTVSIGGHAACVLVTQDGTIKTCWDYYVIVKYPGTIGAEDNNRKSGSD